MPRPFTRMELEALFALCRDELENRADKGSREYVGLDHLTARVAEHLLEARKRAS